MSRKRSNSSSSSSSAGSDASATSFTSFPAPIPVGTPLKAPEMAGLDSESMQELQKRKQFLANHDASTFVGAELEGLESESYKYKSDHHYLELLRHIELNGKTKHKLHAPDDPDGTKYHHMQHPQFCRLIRRCDLTNGEVTLWTISHITGVKEKVWKQNICASMYLDKMFDAYKECVDGGLLEHHGPRNPVGSERGFLSIVASMFLMSKEHGKMVKKFWSLQARKELYENFKKSSSESRKPSRRQTKRLKLAEPTQEEAKHHPAEPSIPLVQQAQQPATAAQHLPSTPIQPLQQTMAPSPMIGNQNYGTCINFNFSGSDATASASAIQSALSPPHFQPMGMQPMYQQIQNPQYQPPPMGMFPMYQPQYLQQPAGMYPVPQQHHLQQPAGIPPHLQQPIYHQPMPTGMYPTAPQPQTSERSHDV